MTDEDENPWWRTVPHLLDSLDKEVRSLYTDGANADPDSTAEVLRCLIIPELRAVLREQGLDVPQYGPYSPHLGDPQTAQEAIGRAEAEIAVVAAEVARETALYRWYDENDLLLYVGISDNLGTRTKGHVKGSSWMEFAARSTVERHADRDAAAAAEEAAIRTERPLFNYTYNNTPEARERLVQYLIDHGRLDLLAPAVSRG